MTAGLTLTSVIMVSVVLGKGQRSGDHTLDPW